MESKDKDKDKKEGIKIDKASFVSLQKYLSSPEFGKVIWGLISSKILSEKNGKFII